MPAVLSGPGGGGDCPRAPAAYVVIPVFNNVGTLRRVAEQVLLRGLPVVVVDDGSGDGSAATLSGLSLEVVRHARNHGKGAALVSGARRVAERGGSHFIVLDADGQFDPADLPAFVEAIRQHPGAILYGIRRFGTPDAPRLSVFGRGFSNFWVRVTTGKKVLDSQAGFRAYPVKTFLGLRLRRRRYDLEVEVLVKAAWAGIDLVGIPVAVTYSPPEGRRSSFRPILDNARIARTYTLLVLRAMLPWPHRILRGGTDRRDDRPLSMLHPVRFIRFLLRERSSPAELGMASALGLFLATLPLIGFHSVAIVFTAGLLRLNRLMAFAVSHLCAPPFVPAVCLEVGYFVRHGHWLSRFDTEVLVHQIGQRFVDYLLGTLLVAPALAAAGGLVTFAVAGLASRSRGTRAEAAANRRGRVAAYGTRAGIAFFRIVLQVLGLRVAYFCLGFVIPYYLLFRPGIRRSMAPYLDRRFPGQGRILRLIRSGRWLHEFSRMLIDQVAIRLKGKGIFSVVAADSQGLKTLLNRDEGTVLVMSHVGGWVVALPSLDFTEKPVSLLLFRDPTDHAMWPADSSGLLKRFRFVDPTAEFGGLVDAVAALSRREVFGVMGDRHWGGRTVGVDFLGERAYVPLLPYRLARSTGSRMVAVLVRRIGYRRFEILHRDLGAAGPSGSSEDRPEAQASAYLAFIEEFLQDSPFQWLNFFDIWVAPEAARERPAAPTAPAGSAERKTG